MKGVTSSTRNGVEYWYARVNGQKKYCGKGAKGRELAFAAKAKDIARSYENKEINAGLKVKKTPFKTVRDIINWYMLLPSSQEKKSFVGETFRAKHILNHFGDKPLNAIDPDRQESYRSHRESEGAASGSIDLEIKLLSAVYHLARKRKKIPHEVMPGEFILKKESVPRRTIADDEFQKLLEHSDDDLADILICGYESGMRVTEICELSAGKVLLDVHHISGRKLDYISLGVFDTKNQTKRHIPISPRLKEVLKRRIATLSSDDFVFTKAEGAKHNKNSVMVLLRTACKKAGIQYGDKARNSKGERTGIVFHSLRHTRITKWVMAGYSDEIIRMASGHKSLDAYRKYIHLDPSAVMRLVEPENPSERHKNGTKIASIL